MIENSRNFIMKKYACNICNEIHEIKLNKKLIEHQTQFPIPYIFLHGPLKNLLTTIYIDKNFEIRSVDVHELNEDDIFSKEQVISIISTLMEEIERLRDENSKLIEQFKKLNKEKLIKN
jgi:hypothetical protein